MKFEFKVVGLDCPEEVNLLKKALAQREGIIDLSFDVLNAKMIVTCESVSAKQITEWVLDKGLKAVLWKDKDALEKATFWSCHGRFFMTVISGIFLAFATYFHLNKSLSAERLYFIAMISGAYFVIPKAYIALKTAQLDINLLMVIAMFGAIAIHEWFEGAMIAFLFSVATLLEHWSMGKARQAISALMNLSPATAHVINKGDVRVEQVQVGERILVLPGETVPLDGNIEKGTSAINQSSITGESIPVQKKEGDDVFAGTLNEDGAFEFRVTKQANDTKLAHIIHLVEKAQSSRAQAQQWVEKFAKIYTPIVMCIAIFIGVIPPLFYGSGWDIWLYRAFVILVIACPCALVISTPVSIVCGITAAARKGVLIKGGRYLEAPNAVRALALDKTGTLTYGRPQVQRLIPLNGYSEEELLVRAAALESLSTHPIARAVLSYAEKKNIQIKKVENFQVMPGKGAQGTFDSKWYWIGSYRFMHDMRQETPEIRQMAFDLQSAGHSVIALGNEKHVCGLISVADEPRAQIQEVIQQIKNAGVEKIVMLTGDHQTAAEVIAKCAGIDEIKSELLPEDKIKVIDDLKKKWKTVAMVGDGINDAPAMAAANFGVSMGAIGTDVAIETSDIVLMSDDLARLPWLIQHSRRCVRMIQKNSVFALVIKGMFLLFAAFGIASIWMAIVADTGATLIVIFNSLRLLNFKKSRRVVAEAF